MLGLCTYLVEETEMCIHHYCNTLPSSTINPFSYSKSSFVSEGEPTWKFFFLCFLNPNYFNSHSHFISSIFGPLDFSSTHFCLEILGIGITGIDLSMITSLPTYVSTIAFDSVTACAVRDLTIFWLVTLSIGILDKAYAFGFDFQDF